MMDYLNIADLAPELASLEVALLLSLVAREQCLIETTEDAIPGVAKELALISSNTFDLPYAVLDCSASTSWEEICSEILISNHRKSYASRTTDSISNNSPGRSSAEDSNVVNVVIAKHFNHATDSIQLQALELIRSKRLASETSILHAPSDFLFIPLITLKTSKLRHRINTHLNDHLFISHFHNPDDGYTYLEDGADWLSDSSVVHKSRKKYARVNSQILEDFRQASQAVTVNADVTRHMQDIVIFLRLNRAVAGGISAKSNGHFLQFARLLAPLHGVDYLTPSLVNLAARKVFRHRIAVAKPEDDRSLQYGSDIRAVASIVEQATPETILDEVLELDAPL